MIRVLIADDHPILRAGVRALVGGERDLEVCGCAADGVEAVELSRRLRPDVVVMDLSMPGMDGLEAMNGVLADHPAVRVLVLTWHTETARVHAALEAGASGYLLKDGGPEELLEALRAVHRGEFRMSEGVAQAVLSCASAGPAAAR